MNRPLRAGERLMPQDTPPPNRPIDRTGGGGGRRGPDPRRPRYAWFRRLLGAALGVSILAVGVAGLVAWRAWEHFSADLPTVAGLKDYHPPLMSRVYNADDTLIDELATQRRIFVPYAAIPDVVKNAFIAAEDQNFWTHNGVDPLAIARAAVTDLQNLHSGRRPIGASTITQQVAKNMILGNVSTFQMKVKEAILAMRMERTLPKERILEIYLNEIYLGLGSYGIAAAAQTYFDKPLDQLTVAEAAFLGALPKGPNNYNPYRFPQAALARRNWVIDRMVDTHAITATEAADAKVAPLVPAGTARPTLVAGTDWFTDEVKRELVARFGADEVNAGGLTVETSLDPKLQGEATDALRAGLLSYERSHGLWRGPLTRLDLAASDARVDADRAGRHVASRAGTDGPGIEGDAWVHALADVKRPPGLLPAWTLGVVLGETATSARIGWLDEPGDALGPPAASHVSPMLWSDASWARTSRGAPARMADVVRPGDVVEVELLEKGTPRAHMALRQVPKVEGAMVCLDPTSGRVLALVGGWSFQSSQFNRATQAERQPGSSFKPIVYLAAMMKGISPSQEFLDGPFAMGNWRPENYEMDYNGMTTLHDALRESLNLVTIRLAAHIGMTSVADLAIAMGETDTVPKYLPSALGAIDTTVLREAGAYATIAEGGHLVTPSLIDSVQDRDGKVIWSPPGFALAPDEPAGAPPGLIDDRRSVSDPDSTFQVVTMMEDVVKRGTGVPAGAGIDRPIAGKTGTTQDFNDAWFVGFTPNLVTAVWVGFDQPASLGDKETGAAVSAPIWNAFMKRALGDEPVQPFRVPDGITLVGYNTGMGYAVDAFKAGQVPGQSTSLGAVAGGGDNTLGPEDTGSELESAIPPPEDGTAAVAQASAGLPAIPGAPQGGPSGAPPGTPRPAAPAASGGSDIGVGGLY